MDTAITKDTLWAVFAIIFVVGLLTTAFIVLRRRKKAFEQFTRSQGMTVTSGSKGFSYPAGMDSGGMKVFVKISRIATAPGGEKYLLHQSRTTNAAMGMGGSGQGVIPGVSWEYERHVSFMFPAPGIVGQTALAVAPSRTGKLSKFLLGVGLLAKRIDISADVSAWRLSGDDEMVTAVIARVGPHLADIARNARGAWFFAVADGQGAVVLPDANVYQLAALHPIFQRLVVASREQ